MADDKGKPTQASANESRRKFIRRVGGSLFTITLVDLSVGTHEVQAAGCGTGGTPPFGAIDLACGLAIKDDNCGISQLPNPEKDHDEQCAFPGYAGTDPDQSCGDCDDTHNADQHCGKKLADGSADKDEICGHQSNIGDSSDDNCSVTVQDVGCGTHTTKYGLPNTTHDTDEHCQGANVDMNCSTLAADTTCNTKTFPSTTSPDEKCSATLIDQACSHYDADESCQVGSTDEACGFYNGAKFVLQDADDACSATDTDDTLNPNKGPIKPWCPNVTDADYWDPPPPDDE